MKRATRTLAIVALTTLVSCSAQLPPASPPAVSEISLDIYTTYATSPLIETISTAYAEARPNIHIETQTGNQRIIIENLRAGEAEYIISQHVDSMSYSDLWIAPIAQDGLVLLTHETNPITQLSSSQLRNIYQGFIRNWQEVGGQNAEIMLISREEGSATRAEFERLVMGKRRTSPNALVFSSAHIVTEAILGDPHAIGYMMLSEHSEQLQTVAIDRITPSLEHIANSTYPLRSTIYIIGQEEPIGAYRSLVGWIQSSLGQKTLATQYAPMP